MSRTVCWLYYVAKSAALPGVEPVDPSTSLDAVRSGKLQAVFSRVEEEAFGQAAIDEHAGDLEWIAEIGERHQAVIAAAFESSSLVPLRAFTLFASEDSIAEWLESEKSRIGETLERVGGRSEWTLRIAFDRDRWLSALGERDETLASLRREMEASPKGKAYLLSRKLEEETKKLAGRGESELLQRIASLLGRDVTEDLIIENRAMRGGGDPRIHLLVPREREGALQEIDREAFREEGVELEWSGPWPPYSFAGGDA